MGNYTLLFRKVMPFITCICFTYVRGCDLVIVTIREWIVGGFGGEGRNVMFEKCKYKNIRCAWDSFSLLGSFYFTNQGW